MELSNSITTDLGNGRYLLQGFIGAVQMRPDVSLPWENIKPRLVRNNADNGWVIDGAPYHAEVLDNGERLFCPDKYKQSHFMRIYPHILTKQLDMLPYYHPNKIDHELLPSKLAMQSQFGTLYFTFTNTAHYLDLALNEVPKLAGKYLDRLTFDIDSSYNIAEILSSRQGLGIPKARIISEGKEIILDWSFKDGQLEIGLDFAGLVFPLLLRDTVDVDIASGDDDDFCVRYFYGGTYWQGTSQSCNVGHMNTDQYQQGGAMRFTSVNIPSGATIDTAYITVVCSYAKSTTTVYGDLCCENTNNPSQIASYADHIGRTRTSSLNWSPNAWTLGTSYQSPSIVTPIQTVVDAQSGTGNALIIFFEDKDANSSSGAYRQFAAYEHASYDPPSLYVEYTSIITPKTSHETGSGADAKKTGNPFAVLVKSETGSGAESLPAKGSVAFETGAGSELASLLAAFTTSETGSGADALAVFLAAFVLSETGSGAEALTMREFILGETGSGIEALIGRLFAAVDSGTGLEISIPELEKFSSDTGTCSLENSYLHIVSGVKESSDSGSGAEASALAVLFGLSDTGSGLEAVVARALYAKEYPSGALDLAKVITAVLSGADVGSGAEASVLSQVYASSDTGAGSEASAIEAIFADSDSGYGAEALTLLAAMIANDAGVGIEKSITFLRKLIDTGEGAETLALVRYVVTGSDVGQGLETIAAVTRQLLDSGVGIEAVLGLYRIALESGIGVDTVASFVRTLIGDTGTGVETTKIIGIVGRAMKLISYLKNYSNVRDYTRPYSDLRAYTREVKK